MPAAAERAVEVGTVAAYVQSVQALLQHYRHMAGSGRCAVFAGHRRSGARCRAAAHEPQVQHLAAELGLADRLADLVQVGLFAPQLELAIHAEQDCALLDAGSRALTARHQQARVAVGFDGRRRADELELQVAVHALDARQHVDLVAHLFPLAVRK